MIELDHGIKYVFKYSWLERKGSQQQVFVRLNEESKCFIVIFSTPCYLIRVANKSLEKQFKEQELYINDKINKNKHRIIVYIPHQTSQVGV